ncbi:MAG: S41 family peptidase [Saprospiraceae bacterium]
MYPKEKILEDLQIFFVQFDEVHPAPFKYISWEKFTQELKIIKNTIGDSISDLAFHNMLRPLFKQIGCGHTTALPPTSWYDFQKSKGLLLPFDVYIANQKCYVRNIFSQKMTLPKGTEVLTVNGNKTSIIIDKMSTLQERDGYNESFQEKFVEKLFRTYYIFLYGNDSTYTLTYLDSLGMEQVVVVPGATAHDMVTTKPVVKSTDDFQIKTTDATCTFFKANPDVAYVDLNKFQSKKYKKFYSSVFSTIKEKEIKHLIIDVRGNGGGYFPNGNRLLRYLSNDLIEFSFYRPNKKIKNKKHLKMPFGSRMTKFVFSLIPDRDNDKTKRTVVIPYKPKKKNHFDGTITVLIDGGSFSMSSYVASKLKHHTDAYFIGNETGGGQEGSNAILQYTLSLPNTGVRVVLPYYVLDHKVTPEISGRGLRPDTFVTYTIEERLARKDKELKLALELIEQKSK